MKAVRILSMLKALLLMTSLFSANSFAGSNGSNHSVKLAFIKPDERNQADFVKKVGETGVFSGEICFSNSNYHSKRNNCDWVVNPDFEVHAFFPDPTIEVTKDLEFDYIRKNNKYHNKEKRDLKPIKGRLKGLKYSYTTPELKLDDTNSFTLIVGKVTKKVKKFLNIKRKLEEQRINIYKKLNREKNGRGKLERMLLDISKKLREVNSSITKVPEIIALIEEPLLVENNRNAIYQRREFFDKYELGVSIDKGLPFGGEEFQIDLSLSLNNKPSLNKLLPSRLRKKDLIVLKAYLDGKEIFKSDRIEIDEGNSIFQTLNIFGLDAALKHNLVIKIIDQHHNHNIFKSKENLVAEFSYDLNIVVDNIAPTWSDDSFPKDNISYYQNFPVFEFVSEDSFGRVLKPSYIGTISYENKSFEKVEQLEISISDDNRVATLSGSIEDGLEGKYVLNLEGSDTSSNSILPNPLIRTIYIDRTKPVINYISTINDITNNPQYEFKINIVDESPTNTQIFKNGILLFHSMDKEIVVQAKLDEGENIFRIESNDKAENVAKEKAFTIVLDTIPPELENIFPGNDIHLNNSILKVSGNSDEELSKVSVNGKLAVLSDDLKSFSYDLTLIDEGNISIIIEAFDLSGNVTTILRNFNFDITPPVLEIDSPLNESYYNDEQISVSGSSNEKLKNVTLNGQLVSISEDKLKFDATNFLLTNDGKTFITIVAEDFAGNKIDVDRIVHLDKLSPDIEISVDVDSPTSSDSTNLSVTISDMSPTITKVYIGGVLLRESSEKLFSQTVPLNAGDNLISVMTVDKAGNSVEKNITVTQSIVASISPTSYGSTSAGGILQNYFSDGTFLEFAYWDRPIQSVEVNGITAEVRTIFGRYYSSAYFNLSDYPPGEHVLKWRAIAEDGSIGYGEEVVIVDPRPIKGLAFKFQGAKDDSVITICGPDFSTAYRNTPITFTTLEGTSYSTVSNSNRGFCITLPNTLSYVVTQSSDTINLTNPLFIDDTPPTIEVLSQYDDKTIYDVPKNLILKSDDVPSYIKVNGSLVDVSTIDENLYSINISDFVIIGQNTLLIEVSNSFNLKTQETVNFIYLEDSRNIRGDLISVAINPENALKSIIIGDTSSISAKSLDENTYFSDDDGGAYGIVVNADGSFILEVPPFISGSIYNGDVVERITGTVEPTHRASLSGRILDSLDNPVVGAKVYSDKMITSNVVFSDSNGNFSLDNISSGVQKVVIDASNVSHVIGDVNYKLSVTSISVSVGTGVVNALERNIYLTGIPLNGSENVLDGSIGITAVNPEISNFSLEIPSGVTNFPNGDTSGVIGLSKVSSDKTTIPPPSFAVPDSVYTLEPSGLSFTEPVKLRLPNDNDFPVGTQLIILSKNSSKGIWEADGVATVSESGESIVTKDGMGITHFSEVFAVPIGLDLKPFNSDINIGADTMNGSSSFNIKLPSVKRFGSDTSFGLQYQSVWANPSAIISNLIDVPRKDVSINFNTDVNVRDITYSINESISSWVEPISVSAQFVTEGIVSDKIYYDGDINRSVVSYAMDMSNISSGVQPYSSKYEIKFKNLTLRTRSVSREFEGMKTMISQESLEETRILDKIFPTDVSGNLFVQNKKDSEFGKGVKLLNVASILNPGERRLLLESVDGSPQLYVADTQIDTVKEFDPSYKVTDITSYPFGHLVDSESNVYEFEFETDKNDIGSPIGSIDIYNGVIYSHANNDTIFDDQWCSLSYFSVIPKINYTQMIGISNSRGNSLYVGESEGNLIEFNINSGSASLYSGYVKAASSNKKINGSGEYGFYGQFASYSQALAFTQQSVENMRVQCRESGIANCDNPAEYIYKSGSEAFSNCEPFDRQSYIADLGVFKLSREEYVGNVPAMLPFAQGNLSPMGVAKGRGIVPSGMVVAYNGSHQVILVSTELEAKVLHKQESVGVPLRQGIVIAGKYGDGQDHGDGGLAIEAGIYRPRGVIYDAAGNLYISSENGYIRRVDPSGIISTFAGKTLADGGVLSDSTTAEDIYLNKPYGMAVDDTNGYLYISDTGNHRIVRIDMVTKIAETIAGSGVCNMSNPNDGKSALGASLCSPTFLSFDNNKNLLVYDSGHNSIRRVELDNSSGINGTLSFSSLNHDGSFLERLSDGSYVHSLRSGVVSTFDSQGKHLETSDRTGKTIRYIYSGDRIVAVRNSLGEETHFDYNFEGYLSKITDIAGRETSFFYDSGALVEVKYPDGTIEEFEYDANGQLLKRFDKRRFGINYTYNNLNRIESVITADGAELNILDKRSLSLGNGSDLDNLSSLRSLNDELQDGLVDALGNTTSFLYDDTGYASLIIDAKGVDTLIERDLLGRPTAVRMSDGSTISYTYSEQYGDLIEKGDNATGAIVQWSYDDFGNLLSKTNAAGEISITNEYNDNGLLIKKTNILGQTTYYTYDTNSLLIQTQNSLGQIFNFEHDTSGNLVKITKPDETVAYFERDDAGNVTKITNALGQVTKRTYDSFNRLTSVTTPKNETTSYQYLATGELSKIIDPIGNETTFEYNSMGRMIKKTDPLGNITNVSYDNNGNVIQEIDPNGNVKTFTYNELDQMTRKSLPDNTYLFEYDIRGNMIAVEDNNSLIEFEYVRKEAGDLVSNVSFEGKGDHSDMGAYQLEMVYDVLGNRTALGTPIGEYQYDYDIGSRLVKISNHKLQEFAFGYDSGNRLTAIASPKHSTDFEFDNTNFLTQIMHTNLSNSVLTSFGYSKDVIGNRTQKRTPAGNFDYGYDDNNQLTSASNPEASSESFNYDSLGNRLQDSLGQYLYDTAKQRIQEDYRFLYTFDNNGNLTTKIEKTNNFNFTNFEYNSQNQLIKIKKFEDNVLIQESSYAYDALGRRMEKVVDHKIDDSKDFTRRFGYDGNELLFETDENNDILASYTQSTLRTDDPLAINITTKGQEKGRALASGDYYYLKDGLGSVTDIINDNGELIQHYIYSSFGELLKVVNRSGADISTSPILDPFVTYTSREHDKESGLYYYRARYYEPALGQFLTADPDPGSLDSPNSFLSKFTYVANNPIANIDPSGLSLSSIIDDIGDLANKNLSKSTQRAIGFAAGFITVAAFSGPLAVGVGVGLMYGALTAKDSQSPLAKAIRFGLVGGVAAITVQLTIGSAAPGVLTTGEAILGGAGIGAGSGYMFADTVGANPLEAAFFGATVGTIVTTIPGSGGFSGSSKSTILEKAKGASSAYPPSSTRFSSGPN